MPAALAQPLIDHREDIARLCHVHGVERLEVFGSAADGRFNSERSDYDFIASFDARGEPSLGRRFVAFAEALEGLLGRPVDLMTDHPIENPYLRRAIDASRQLVFSDEAAETSV